MIDVPVTYSCRMDRHGACQALMAVVSIFCPCECHDEEPSSSR